MPFAPTDPLDRLAELETKVARLESQLAANRAATAERVEKVEVWAARTIGATDYVYHPYPTYSALCAELPVVLLRLQVRDNYGSPAWGTQPELSAASQIHAITPIGWLPPNTLVEVTQQTDQRWRIVRWPTTFFGRVESASNASIMIAADTAMQLHSALLHVYENQSGGGIYAMNPCHYRSGNPVLMGCLNWLPTAELPRGAPAAITCQMAEWTPEMTYAHWILQRHPYLAGTAISQSAGGTYTSNEQLMLANLKTQVNALIERFGL